MAGWIGPVLVAAVIAAFVSVAGWFVTAGLTLRAERRKREEKTRDFRIALRAEIRSELAGLVGFDLEADLGQAEKTLMGDGHQTLFVPRLVRHVVLETLMQDLFILPEGIIDPLVVYLRLREAVGNLSDDLRNWKAMGLDRPQQLDLYRDLVSLRARLAETAASALLALERSE